MATAPVPLTYQQYLSFYKLAPTAANALAYFKSGHAPMGTVIPQALRSQLGGATTVLSPTGTYNVPLAAGQQPTGFTPLSFTTAPGTPAGTLPPPVNNYLPQMVDIIRQAGLLPTTYNAQRQAAAQQTAAGLAGSGLVDFGIQAPHLVNGQIQYDYSTPVAQTPDAFSATPDIKYGIVQGADGAASRGVFSGSQIDQQQALARQGLDVQRQAAYTNLQNQQNTLLGNQQNALAGLQRSWADYSSKAASDAINTVAGWQATPSVPPTISTTGLSPQQPTNPSPLTQMTGGQRTVTGAAGTISKAIPKVSTGITSAATKLVGGLTTRKLGG
jgi:hypothetical protein